MPGWMPVKVTQANEVGVRALAVQEVTCITGYSIVPHRFTVHCASSRRFPPVIEPNLLTLNV